jgi:hypothetical protein
LVGALRLMAPKAIGRAPAKMRAVENIFQVVKKNGGRRE